MDEWRKLNSDYLAKKNGDTSPAAMPNTVRNMLLISLQMLKVSPPPNSPLPMTTRTKRKRRMHLLQRRHALIQSLP